MVVAAAAAVEKIGYKSLAVAVEAAVVAVELPAMPAAALEVDSVAAVALQRLGQLLQFGGHLLPEGRGLSANLGQHLIALNLLFD